MKNLLSKISLVGLFLLPLPAFSSMADKYNAGPECTVQEANFKGTSWSGKIYYMCVKGNKVYRAYKPSLSSQVNNMVTKMDKGFIGKMTQYGESLHEYAIKGDKLLKYSCRGYFQCDGPIQEFEHATRIK